MEAKLRSSLGGMMAEEQKQETKVQETNTDTKQEETSTEQKTGYISPREQIFQKYFSAKLEPAKQETQQVDPQDQRWEKVAQGFQSMASKLEQLEQRLGQTGQQSTQQNGSAQPQAGADDEFIQSLSKGDIEGAKRALLSEVDTNFGNNIRDQLTRDTTSQVIQVVRAENEIKQFADGLRMQNPDLAPFERAITLSARDMVNDAYQRGEIKNISDYVAATKSAIKVAATDMQNKLLQARGEGKQEAMTRQTAVTQSQALNPGLAKTQSQEQRDQQEELPQDSASLTKRALEQRQTKQHGLRFRTG